MLAICSYYYGYTIFHSNLAYISSQSTYLYFLLSFFSVLSYFSLKNHYQNVFPLPELPYRVGVHPRREFKPPSDYINQKFQKGDIIVHANEATHSPFLYYHNNRLKEMLFILSCKNNIFYCKKAYFYSVYSEIFKRVKIIDTNPEEILKSNYKRIWLVLSAWENNKLDQTSRDIKEYFDKNYIELECKEFADLKVYLYQIYAAPH